ncbi:MAG TPA: hypothetical protein H9881_05060 [Candidatus Stackebrandtia excrementipullorum]|nr:hypothetical protein [Candidatus Stackebrandtia excrementipullorum]
MTTEKSILPGQLTAAIILVWAVVAVFAGTLTWRTAEQLQWAGFNPMSIIVPWAALIIGAAAFGWFTLGLLRVRQWARVATWVLIGISVLFVGVLLAREIGPYLNPVAVFLTVANLAMLLLAAALLAAPSVNRCLGNTEQP